MNRRQQKRAGSVAKQSPEFALRAPGPKRPAMHIGSHHQNQRGTPRTENVLRHGQRLHQHYAAAPYIQRAAILAQSRLACRIAASDG